MAHNEGNENEFSINFRNEEQKARFDNLISGKLVCTRYLDITTMDILGIRDDIDWKISIFDWYDMMYTIHPTYRCLTLEFLSLLETTLPRIKIMIGKLSFD